jgi:hypothetical protein
MTTAVKLTNPMKARQFVRFNRRFEESSTRGYVVDVGPKFFLLALVSDRIHFDGFEVFRIKDIRDLRPDPYEMFVESALKRRRERQPRKPKVRLDDVGTLLETASRCFPLVTIHRERIRPDICHIGRVVGVGRGRVSLLEIDAYAKWDTEPTEYPLKEITRVNFGGDYEAALHLVGGEAKHPPESGR